MKRFLLGLSLACLSSVSQADFLGLINGRTADIINEPQMTVEGGMSLQSDFNTIGGKLNFKVAPDMLIYGGLASVDADAGGSDIAFGGGVVYQLGQSLIAGMDMAVKGSYHMWDGGESFTGGKIDYSLSDFGVELLISPQEQSVAQGVKVFGMVGLHRVASEVSGGGLKFSDDSMEIALGGGASMLLGPGEAYAGIELIDELFIGAGYRLALGQ